MTTGRLEAFSDGVLAVIITIMVLELRVPDGDTLGALVGSTGTPLLTYLLSFVYVAIYWNNHHHMFQLAGRATGAVLWANLGLLFCLSLVPFTTAWMDDSDLARTPVAVYGVNLLACALAYLVLQAVIVRSPEGARLRAAVGSDWKGKSSLVLYLCGIVVVMLIGARLGVWLALACFVAVAVIWLVPDRRIARTLQ